MDELKLLELKNIYKQNRVLERRLFSDYKGFYYDENYFAEFIGTQENFIKNNNYPSEMDPKLLICALDLEKSFILHSYLNIFVEYDVKNPRKFKKPTKIEKYHLPEQTALRWINYLKKEDYKKKIIW